MKLIKYSLLTALLIAIVGLAGYFFYPWQNWAEQQLVEKLRASGVPLSDLQLEEITLTHADFSNVTLDLPNPLVVPTLRVEYTKDNLLAERLDRIELRGIDYHLDLSKNKDESPQSAIALPSPELFSSLPVNHVVIADSQLRISDADFSAIIPLVAEIKQAATPLVKVQGSNAQITLKQNGEVQIKDWNLALDSEQKIWQVAFGTQQINVKLNSGKESSKPASAELSIPQIDNIKLTSLTLPEIIVNYNDSDVNVQTAMEATLSNDQTNLKLKSKQPLSVSLSNGSIIAPTWHATILWPKQKILVDDIVADGMAIILNSQPSADSSYPMPELLEGIPVGKIRSNGSKITSHFKEGSFAANFNADGKISPATSMNITTASAVLSMDKQKYNFEGLSGQVRASKGYWLLSGKAKKLHSPTQQEVDWLPLALRFDGNIKSQQIYSDVKLTHKDFQAETGILLTSKQTILTSPTANIAAGKISAPRIIVSDTPIVANLNFTEVKLEELLQLILKDDKSVKATGRVSGTVPIRYKPGEFRIGDGALNSLDSGFISIGEQHLGVLPQGNEQVENVTNLLKHFEYQVLELKTDENENGQLSVLVALKGRSPAVYEGAEVHLNVNLRGDVLETITSTLGIVKLPERYMKGTVNAQ